MNSQFNKTVSWLESLFSSKPKFHDPSIQIKQTIAQAKPKEQYQDVEIGRVSVCKDTALGEVKYKKMVMFIRGLMKVVLLISVAPPRQR